MAKLEKTQQNLIPVSQKSALQATMIDILKNNLQTESVDYRVLAEMRMFDEHGFQDLIERLVTQFIENTPKQIIDLKHAVLDEDPCLKNKAYSLKVVCAGLGAKKMMRILDIIEEGRTSMNNTLMLIEGLEDAFFVAHNELLPFSSWYSLINSEA